MPQQFSCFALLSLFGFLSCASVAALPYPSDHDNFNITRLPRDSEDSMMMRHINSSHFDRRDSTKCSDLSIEQAKKSVYLNIRYL